MAVILPGVTKFVVEFVLGLYVSIPVKVTDPLSGVQSVIFIAVKSKS